MISGRQRNLISFGLIFGTIGGALAAYFLAPKRGDETKKIVAKKANHLTQKSILQVQSKLIDFEQILEKSLANETKRRKPSS